MQAFDAQSEIASLRTQLEEQLDRNSKLAFELQERNKELTFQNKLTQFLDHQPAKLDDVYQYVAELLPSAFQFPQKASIFLQVYGQRFTSLQAQDSKNALSVDLKDGGIVIGNIRVAYPEESEDVPQDLFFPEEEALLVLLAQRIVSYTVKNRDEISLFYNWEKYRELFDSISEVLFEVSLGGTIQYVSNSSKQILGYEPIELIGRKLFNYLHPEDRPKLFKKLHVLEVSDNSFFDFRYITKIGQYKWCRTSALPILVQGQRLGARGILTDIDNLKSTQYALEQSEKMLNGLFHRMVQGVIYQDRDGNVIKANPAALSLLGLSLEQMNDLPRSGFQWHLISEDGSRVPYQQYPPLRALATGERIQNEIMGIVHTPDSMPIWVLISSEPEFRAGESTPSQVFTTFTNITKRKEVEHNLNAQIAYTNSILQAIPDGILILDKEGKILEYKPSVGNSKYLYRETFVDYNIREVLPGINLSAYLENLANGTDDSESSISQFEMMIGGTLHYLESRMSRLSDDRIVAVVRDNTLRKQAELELYESNRKIKVLMNNLRGVAFRARNDEQWTMDFISDGILELTGYDPTDFLDNKVRSYNSIIHDDDRQLVWSQVQTGIATNSQYTVEYRIVTATHEMKWVWEKGQGIFEDGQLLYLEGFISDITERKDAELALRKNEEKYRSLVESLDAAILILDSEGRYLFWNSLAEAYFGKSPENLVSTWTDQLFPLDQSEHIVMNVKKVLRENHGLVINSDMKIIGGENRWYRTSMQPIHDEHGKPIAVTLSATDITTEKEAAIQLKKLSTAIEQSPVSVVITNLDGVIEYVNPKACETTGYSKEELIGQNPKVLKSGETTPHIYDTLWETISGGAVWRGVFHNKRKDGELYWESSTIAPITNDDGKISHYIAIKEDITEKQQMQKELVINESRFREVAEHSRTVVWEINLEGMYTYVSPVSVTVYGYTPSELIGIKTIYDLYPEEEREEFKKYTIEVMQKHESVSNFDNPVVRKDGGVVWVSTSTEPLFDENHRLIGYRGVDFDINQRKQTEIELRKFQTISDQANYGNAITDMKGTILYLNDCFARMHGYEVKELLGGNLALFHNAEQLPRVFESLELLKKNGEFSAREIWRTRKDGSVFPSLMNAKVIIDSQSQAGYMIANAVDITEMKLKEAAIKRLETAIEQSPVALVITDLEARITYVSPAFTAITGYSTEEAAGKKTSLLKSGNTDLQIYVQLWETIQAGKVWKGELINRKKNGELYYESMSISPIYNLDGKLTNYLAIKEDITDRRKIEDEKIARKAAEEANRSKSIFLSNMSHEIRTPLNAIIGFAQILERDVTLSAKQIEHMQTITRSGRHLLELINDILDLSKIEAGKIVYAPAEFSLSDLLDDLQAMFGVLADKKNLQLLFEREDSLPHYIVADEGKLRQVLINILGNAVKFTSVGGIVARFRLDKTLAGEHLHIEVQDSGPGIPETDLEKIFDSFRQSEAGKKFGGTGLGLAISRKLLEVMGGWIRVDSVLGKGSVFQFSLPVTRILKLAGKDPYKRITDVIGLDLGDSEYRILVVDDGRDNRELLKNLLEPIGFKVTEAINGKEALELYAQLQPHLILMDLRMPVMDGYEATKLIKALNKGKSVPIIAVTASAFEDDEKAVLARGFDGYIRKPFKIENLFEQLGKNLGLPFMYAQPLDQSDGSSKMRTIAKADMEKLPVELTKEMYVAIEQGDMMGFKDLLTKVGVHDPGLADFLQKLAKVYDYEKLLELLHNE